VGGVGWVGGVGGVKSLFGCESSLIIQWFQSSSFQLTVQKTQRHPIHQVKITDQALTSFAIQDNGAVVAAGASDGATHVLRLSAGLSEMVQNEKQGIAAMLERETLRCGLRLVRGTRRL